MERQPLTSRHAAVGAGVAVVATLLLLVIPSVQGQTLSSVSAVATTADAAGAGCEGSHWVGTWQAAPQSSSLGRADDATMGLADGPERVFRDQSLRMVVMNHIGGSAVRVHLGNRYGTAPLTLSTTTLGLRSTDADLAPGSVQALTFGGSRSVVVGAGDEVVSDPLFVDVTPFSQLAVTFAVAGSAPLDYHQWGMSTHYVAPAGSGDHADDESGAAFTEEITSSYGVTAIDVLAPSSVGAVVTLGDSITDGIGSSPNTNQRWPDQLAHRLLGSLSVVNAGIGGNHVATSGLTTPFGIGEAARDRVRSDALAVAGVTDLFVYEGINDIFMSDPASDPAAKIIAGYRSIIDQAHATGLRVTGATITPAGMDGAKEAARQVVNEWIRTSNAYDSVVDFDEIARDPASPSKVRPEFDAFMAHMTDAGYGALAGSIDLDIFQGAGCSS